MPRYSKVIWSEGMFLTPHHIQQWDIYQERGIDFRMNSILPYGWGLRELDIDRDGLGNGNFILLRCRGILRGGCIIDYDIDNVNIQRKIDEHFQPNMDFLDVYLAVPVERQGAANCALNEAKVTNETRYIQDSVSVMDYNTGQNEKEIAIARKNVKLLFQDEVSDDYDLLKIARLVRNSTGGFGLHNDFIPSCLSISCSPRMMGIVRGLLELLTAKSNELSAQCRQRTSDVYEFGPTDVSNLWLLQTVNSYIPLLSHFYRSQVAHPEHLFRMLAQFFGELSTMAVKIRPGDIPEYRHDDLMFSFNVLDAMIRDLLALASAPSAKYRVIPLQKVSEFNFQGRIDDANLFMLKFFMGVKADVSQEKMIDEIPKKAKIGSIETIDLLTHSALPGVTLYYSALPPASIPRKSGYIYFALDNRGPYWDSIRKSSSIAVFMPPDFTRAEIEMMAVED